MPGVSGHYCRVYREDILMLILTKLVCILAHTVIIGIIVEGDLVRRNRENNYVMKHLDQICINTSSINNLNF